MGAGRIRCVLIILASDVASNEQFADNVIGRGFAIEFAAQVRCWQGGKSWLHAKSEIEGSVFDGAVKTGVI